MFNTKRLLISFDLYVVVPSLLYHLLLQLDETFLSQLHITVLINYVTVSVGFMTFQYKEVEQIY